MKFKVYDTGKKVFISLVKTQTKVGSVSRGVSDLLFDGKEAEKSQNSDWFVLDKIPTTIQRYKPRGVIRKFYRLVDESFVSDRIPLEIEYDAIEHDSYSDWLGENSSLQSLYNLVYDYSEPELEDISFSLDVEQIVGFSEQGSVFNFNVYRSQYKHEGIRNINFGDLKYDPKIVLLYPDIIYRQNAPVTIPSKTLYDIVRKYILDNINTEVSHISSDYAFCFEVKKRISREPKLEKIELFKKNGGSYSPRKYKERVVKYAGDRTVFEMTHEQDRYKGYTPIPSLSASNLQELEEKLNRLLEELITKINTPLKLCNCCAGTGLDGDQDVIKVVEFFGE